MKVSCEMIQDMLPLYCDGVCSQSSINAVNEHLKICEKCRTDFHFMKENIKTDLIQEKDNKAARAAAVIWKKGKKQAFIKGCLAVLLIIAILTAGYCLYHWFATVSENNIDALAQQASVYLKHDNLVIEKVAQKGNYLAALCRNPNGDLMMCQYDRDSVFKNRWRANGGSYCKEDGEIGSLNFGCWNNDSSQPEAVLIFYGANIPNEVCWYEFENNNIIYTCPVDNETLLDIFIIPYINDINAVPVFLDKNKQVIE